MNVETGSYASDDLRKHSVTLSGRDAGLASQIVFGCLRFQNQLDFLIVRYSGRKLAELDPEVRVALRGAIFQIRYLERVPAHAAVNDSVEFVKKRKRAASGLTNAVLRKVKQDEVAWPDRAIALSCPEWLLRRWQYSFGEEAATAIGKAALTEPQHYVRIPQGEPIPTGDQVESGGNNGGRLLSSERRHGRRAALSRYWVAIDCAAPRFARGEQFS